MVLFTQYLPRLSLPPLFRSGIDSGLLSRMGTALCPSRHRGSTPHPGALFHGPVRRGPAHDNGATRRPPGRAFDRVDADASLAGSLTTPSTSTADRVASLTSPKKGTGSNSWQASGHRGEHGGICRGANASATIAHTESRVLVGCHHRIERLSHPADMGVVRTIVLADNTGAFSRTCRTALAVLADTHIGPDKNRVARTEPVVYTLL